MRKTILLFSILFICKLVSAQQIAGTKFSIGAPGTWSDVVNGTMLNSYVYTIHTDGKLKQTYYMTGKTETIGSPDYANTMFLFASADKLYRIDNDGSLFSISIDGTMTAVGNPGDWKKTVAGTIVKGTMYSVESDGALYKTYLESGMWERIGEELFLNVVWLFGFDDKEQLALIDSDGKMKLVNISTGISSLPTDKTDKFTFFDVATKGESNIIAIAVGGEMSLINIETGMCFPFGDGSFLQPKVIFSNGKNIITFIDFTDSMFGCRVE